VKVSTARKTYLREFTSDTNFDRNVSRVLGKLQAKIQKEGGQREDSLAETGLIGLAVHTKEKSQRIFNKVAGKKRSTEKFQDELWDNLAYALYLVLYWEMLDESERSKKE